MCLLVCWIFSFCWNYIFHVIFKSNCFNINFTGYNSILRRGHITYNEYIQVGKGRDVGLNQISKFEAKVANGNSEQTLSRDIYRLGRRFDFFRMLSCYFTTVGFYLNSLVCSLSLSLSLVRACSIWHLQAFHLEQQHKH